MIMKIIGSTCGRAAAAAKEEEEEVSRTRLLSSSSNSRPPPHRPLPPVHLKRSSLDLGLIGGPQIDPILPADCGNLRCERAGTAWALRRGAHHRFLGFFLSMLGSSRQDLQNQKSDAAAQNFILSTGLYGLAEGNIRQRRRKK